MFLVSFLLAILLSLLAVHRVVGIVGLFFTRSSSVNVNGKGIGRDTMRMLDGLLTTGYEMGSSS